MWFGSAFLLIGQRIKGTLLWVYFLKTLIYVLTPLTACPIAAIVLGDSKLAPVAVET